jgi:hypothetical protein
MRAYWYLLRAYPPDLVREHGEEMIQLVRDRRTLGEEPWWRLWPSVLADTARCASAMRWERLMSAHRPPLAGMVASIALLAVLSDGLHAAAPVLLGCTLVVFAMFGVHLPAEVARPRRSWASWTVTGVTLLVGAISIAVARSADARELEWGLLMLGGFGGFFALSTGAVALVEERWTQPTRNRVG